MWSVLVAFNILVLSVLALLLAAEERRYRRLKARVEQTRTMLLGVASKIRSPLSMLHKYNGLFRAGAFGKASIGQMEAIYRMEEATVSVAMEFNRLLVASHLDTGVIPPQPVELDLRDSVGSVVDTLSGLAAARSQTLTFARPDKSFMLTANPLILHGILDELLLNAIKYTPENGTVEVTMRRKKDRMEIAVRDTGIGIGPEEMPSVFDRYFRGERAKAMGPGNGLGLAFAKHFADAIGASIAVSSKEDKGSVFTVSLPSGR